ncbi:MAG: DUF1684 domain-containing protein [Xanthomonadales bacterium]|nr:DUF1684 domain-containing protein [Xanthomonadales bacterium]
MLLQILFVGALAASPVDADHVDSVMEWRLSRLTSLTGPSGWLSLIGLHWLENGSHAIGSAPADNDVVLNAGPARVGEIRVSGPHVAFSATPGVPVTHAGEPVEELVLFSEDLEEAPILEVGSVSLFVIERGDRLAIRVKDAAAPTRVGFRGIDYFPIKPDFRVEARFQRHPEGHTIEIVDVTGLVSDNPNPGRLVFELGGTEYSVEAVGDEGDDELFIIFGDRTNGKSTYGAGRFVYTPWPEDGTTVLDFNRAYNPPCVFTEYSTCPLPPQANRIPVLIEAGEKDYK